MNPADYKGFARGDRASLPRPVGSEVAGVLAALGPDTEIASGGGAVGDEVLAFRIAGGYASAVTVPAADVFAKPAALDFPAAANLLLAGATAAETLQAVKVGAGETILVHGASGAVGVSVLQQARLLGARAVGTASERSFETVRRFGGVPVAYGPGLADRVRAAAPDGGRGRDRHGRHRRGRRRLAGAGRRPGPDRHDRRDRPGRRDRHPLDRRRQPGQRGLPRRRPPAADPAGRRRRPGRPDRPHLPAGRGAAGARLLMTGHPGGKLALLPRGLHFPGGDGSACARHGRRPDPSTRASCQGIEQRRELEEMRHAVQAQDSHGAGRGARHAGGRRAGAGDQERGAGRRRPPVHR